MKPTQEDIKSEFWLPIPGYETFYEASSLGRIKSLTRVVKTRVYDMTIKERIRKLSKAQDGYNLVQLHKEGVRVAYAVSRIIGKLFVPNPDNLPEINHLDLVKDNDFYKNLEWCTREQNMQHAFANKNWCRGTVTKKHIDAMVRKPIYAYHKETKEILRFDSNKSCAEHFGVNSSTISATIKYGNRLRGKYKLLRENEYLLLKEQA